MSIELHFNYPNGQSTNEIYISIYRQNIRYLENPDDIVIDRSPVNIAYSYPFTNSDPISENERFFQGFIFEETSPNGQYFTRRDLVVTICRRYKQMYDEEDSTSTVRPRLIPGFLNRIRTNGIYGIWGHVLEDLILQSIQYDAERDVYYLEMEA